MIIYDIEIAKAIPPRDGGHRTPGIEYCQGWHDLAGMGIACVCAYDYRTGECRAFFEDNLDDFFRLVVPIDEPPRRLVGFNNHHFDDRLLFASGNMDLDAIGVVSYDLLQLVWTAAGLGSEYVHDTHAGYGLDALCCANLGAAAGKTGTGEQAPRAWQAGRRGAVVDYCLRDVWLTRRLLDRVLARQRVICPHTDAELTNLPLYAVPGGTLHRAWEAARAQAPRD